MKITLNKLGFLDVPLTNFLSVIYETNVAEAIQID